MLKYLRALNHMKCLKFQQGMLGYVQMAPFGCEVPGSVGKKG